MRTRGVLVALCSVAGLLFALTRTVFSGGFADVRTFSVGTSPQSVAVGDFNGDGKPDLVVANSGSNNVSILLGNGDGTFQYQVTYTTGTTPYSVAVGDFNGDTHLDLAVANDASNSVSILLGNGDGTFQNAVNYSVGSNPHSVAVGDFNRDGKLDVVTANYSSGNVSVLLGNGNGTLQTMVNYAAGTDPRSVTVADFNGDGAPDVAVANGGSSNVSVLLNNGSGVLQAAVNYGAGPAPTSVAAGDFNNDGRPDLAVTNSSGVDVLLNTGIGTFGTAVSYAAGTGPSSVVVSDFNNDHNQDLLVGNTTSNNISILTGNGDGTFNAANSYLAGSQPASVAAADINGDGNQDAVIVNSADGTVDGFVGEGNGNLQAILNLALNGTGGPEYVVAADFNNDGHQDLATATYYSGGFVFLGMGAGTFGSWQSFPSVFGSNNIGVADFNGDGKPDLVVTSSYDQNASIFLGNGDGTFRTGASYGVSEPLSLAVGDFNGDGRPDFATVDFSELNVFLGKGDGTFTLSTLSAPPYSQTVTTADFNGDGYLDLAIGNSGNPDMMSVLLGNGDGTFGSPAGYPLPYASYGIVAGDFNGDGHPDLAVSCYTYLSIFLGNGDGTFQGAMNYTGNYGAAFAATGDFNGDGRLDLATTPLGGSSAEIDIGNGDGTFQQPISYGVGAGTAVTGDAVADFNGDGAPDLVVSDYSKNQLGVLINTGGTYVSLASSQNPSAPGQPVTFTLAITASIPGSGNPTGSVTFMDGNTVLGSGTVSNGQASYTTSSLSIGLHSITGVYSGDSNFNPHTSPVLTQTVASGPLVTFSPGSLTFGNQNVGSTSAPQNVILTNAGTATLSITSISTTGDFGQTNNCGSSIGVGGSCTIMVTFTPTTTGTRTGTVSVTDNATGSPQSLSLTGMGTQPLVSISPASLTFPSQLVFTGSRPEAATLTNTGTGALTISGISATGNFSQTNTCGATVAVGASCQISVTFRPAGKGTLSGGVLIADNAPGSPQSLTLTGTGTVVLLSETRINFGSIPVGHTAGPDTLTLSNVANQPLTVQSIGITGADSSDFSETNTCGSSVPPRGSCSISVSFTPHVKGPRSAILSIRDNGGGSPQTVTLSGAGD